MPYQNVQFIAYAIDTAPQENADGSETYLGLDGRPVQDIEARCTFRVERKRPELWDPVTGTARALTEFTARQDSTTVPLRFAPRQSFFVVFRKKGASSPGQEPNFAPSQLLVQLPGPWEVSFDPRWGGPDGETCYRERRREDDGAQDLFAARLGRDGEVALRLVLGQPSLQGGALPPGEGALAGAGAPGHVRTVGTAQRGG